MFALLLAYIDFGQLQTTADRSGAPTAAPRWCRGDDRLACRHLERVSTLFTRSVTARDPEALLAASREALAAAPVLYTAGFQLAAVPR